MCLLMATFAEEFEDKEQKKWNSLFCVCTQTHIEMLLFVNIRSVYCYFGASVITVLIQTIWMFWVLLNRNEVGIACLMRERLYLTYPCLCAQHPCNGFYGVCTQIFVEIICQVNFTS